MEELRNTLSRPQALDKLKNERFVRRTMSFYRYVHIEDPAFLREELYREWDALNILGRIYLAREGINAQLSVPECNVDKFIVTLEARDELKNMPLKWCIEEGLSFVKLTVRVKRAIVADGLTEDSYDTSGVGNHLDPEAFNAAMADPNTVVVDMRNNYESRIGHFKKAICPNVTTFREALPEARRLLKGKEDKKILLYCTGGIRCEKASSYLKHYGFVDVNQLYGGIINYAHEVKRGNITSFFAGKNFVFDDRLSERVTADVFGKCDQCKDACDDYTNCGQVDCNLLFIQCVSCKERFSGACSKTCQKIATMPETVQRMMRKRGVRRDNYRFCHRIQPKYRRNAIYTVRLNLRIIRVMLKRYMQKYQLFRTRAQKGV